MFPVLNIGRLVLPTAPLVYLLGTYLSLSAVEWAAKRLGLRSTATYEVAANAVIVGVVGARLVFILQHLDNFLTEPISIVWPLTSGYNAVAGFIVGAMALLYFMRRQQMPLWQTLDAVVIGLLVVLAAISFADGLSRASSGATTDVPWGFVIANVRRHPVALYEIGVLFLGFAAWWRARPSQPAAGQLFWIVVGVVSFGRFLTEAYRANSFVIGNGYRLVQLIAFGLVLLTMAVFARQTEQTP